MGAIDTHATKEELLEAAFSVRSVPRLYNKNQLPFLLLHLVLPGVHFALFADDTCI
jgi:hypothetical protein